MNLLEIYVTNITKHEIQESSYNGQTIRIHRLVADKDCYGAKQYQVEFTVSESDYQSILNNGYYVG
ncbi:MAG: hypothetical protein Q4F79_00035 [Eubacteriales bacterium]|nr:hypothetical protein [Eubacteriales bacterium]